MLELQAALAGALGNGLHAAVILVPRPVEDDLRDPGLLGAGRQQLPDLSRLLDLLPFELVVGDGEQRARRRVVDELGVDVLERAEDDEARALRRPLDLLPDAEVATVALLGARLRNGDLRHYFPPALPALRRTCSP